MNQPETNRSRSGFPPTMRREKTDPGPGAGPVSARMLMPSTIWKWTLPGPARKTARGRSSSTWKMVRGHRHSND
ncbi:MAG TPA: hypothetical protein VFO91_06900 [Anaerolineales bacterium]|nr:hypothetical protein [Anaerolineales bacterium]